MKKILVLILALGVILGLVSCKPKDNQQLEHTVHTDENKDGLCDGCRGIFVDYSEPSLVGNALKHSLERQFDETKSLKFEFELEVIVEEDSWSYEEYYDDELNDYVDLDTTQNIKYYHENLISIDLWLSMGDNGVNAKIETKSGSRSTSDVKFEYSDKETSYIIDGYSYTSIDGNCYKKSEAVPEETLELLEKLGSAELLSEETKDELLTALGVEVATVFNIKDNKGSYSIDAKPTVDKLITYITELDMDKDTIGGVIDDALKLISPDLTSAKIVDELERVAGLTVTEALDELDEWLTENYQTTLQGIYDSIINDPDVISTIETLVAYAQNLDLNNAEDKKAIDEIISQLKEFDIREMIKDEGIHKATIFGLVLPSLPPASADPETGEYVYFTKDELFTTIRSFLNMTLAEFDSKTGANIFAAFKQAASYITVNKLNAKVDLNFEGALSLASVDGEVNFDIGIKRPSDVEGKEDYQRIAISASFKLSEISSEEKEISLPKDAAVLSNCYTSGESYVNVYYYSYLADLRFTIYDQEAGAIIEIYADNIPIEDLAENSVTISDYDMYVNDSYYHFDDPQNFVFSLNSETGTFTIVELPDWELASDY